jgi:hypothetical protein
MKMYSECLQKNGLCFTIIVERQPENTDLKILFLGDAYIFANKFAFTLIEDAQ